jgi:hypothetical protein
MKKLQDWMKTWTPPQAIVAGVALVCVTALAITITVTDDWGKLFRWLADPATSGLLVAVVTLFGTLYHRALSLPPVLVLAILGAAAVGCGGSLTDSQRAALAVRTQQCLLAERAIVDDPCGSLTPEECEARDTAALAASRAECDHDRAAIVGGGQ